VLAPVLGPVHVDRIPGRRVRAEQGLGEAGDALIRRLRRRDGEAGRLAGRQG
jgi:hypothetical protein